MNVNDRISSLKLTPIRQEVLDILRQAGYPMTAYGILDKLEQGAKKPQTVYRALDYLITHGLAHRLDSLNAYVACQNAKARSAHSAGFLICRQCGLVRELPEMERLEQALEDYGQQAGFSDLQSTVEVRGLCAGCRNT